jgi:hypothetical protein
VPGVLRRPRVREWLPEDQPPIFAAVRTMLRSAYGRIGGVGLKLHPDYSYGPYHWLVGEISIGRELVATVLPEHGRPCFKSPHDPALS